MKQQDAASPRILDERMGDGRDVTTILDADATIRYVSPSIEPILGYKPEQLVGQNWFQYVHPDDAAQALPGFGQTTQQPGVVQRNALRVRHANGSWVNVEEVGSNLLHYPGVHGWILNARNAGANGTAAATPTTANGKDEGTSAPERSATAQAGDPLDAADRSSAWYTQLLAALSHELRTPLNVIIGYHDLLLDGTFGNLSAEQAYTLRRAHRSAREMLDVIASTLDLSRLDTGRIRLATQTIAARDLFEELGREMRDIYDKPGVALEWRVATDTPKVATDPAKLKLIVKNLVRNAVQLSDRGTIAVAVQPYAEGLEIAVRDSGGGSSRDVLTAICEAPHQPDPATLERFGGSGLGLHTARRLVGLLGGSMTVETDASTGSTIRVFIPSTGRLQRAS